MQSYRPIAVASAAPPQLWPLHPIARSPHWLKYGILIAIEFAQRAPVSSPAESFFLKLRRFLSIFYFEHDTYSSFIFLPHQAGRAIPQAARVRYTTAHKNPVSTAIKKKHPYRKETRC